MFRNLCSILFLISLCHKMSRSNTESYNENNTMAIAIYEPKIFTIFKTDVREFSFAGNTVNIRQEWETNGVAAVVWDAALVLAKYLEANDNLSGKKVIELGAGTGLVGIVAAYLGANVVITDRSIALDLALENVKRNKNLRNIAVEELEWGQDILRFNPPFEMILGADIVYIEETFPLLIKTINELSNENTIVLLSCKIRYQRDRNFIHMLSEKFIVTQVHYDETVDIYVYKAYKKKGVQ